MGRWGLGDGEVHGASGTFAFSIHRLKADFFLVNEHRCFLSGRSRRPPGLASWFALTAGRPKAAALYLLSNGGMPQGVEGGSGSRAWWPQPLTGRLWRVQSPPRASNSEPPLYRSGALPD